MRCRGGSSSRHAQSASWRARAGVGSAPAGSGRCCGGPFVEGAPPTPRDRRGRDHAARVRLGVGHVAQPRPGDVGLGQRLLHQVLRQLVVAEEEVRHPEQGGGTGRDERAELLGVPRRGSCHVAPRSGRRLSMMVHPVDASERDQEVQRSSTTRARGTEGYAHRMVRTGAEMSARGRLALVVALTSLASLAVMVGLVPTMSAPSVVALAALVRGDCPRGSPPVPSWCRSHRGRSSRDRERPTYRWCWPAGPPTWSTTPVRPRAPGLV